MDMFKLTQKKNKWIENISPPRVLTCPMSGITLSMANDDEMSESSANGILDSPPRCPNSKNNSTPPSKKSKKQSRKTSVSTVVSQMTRSTEESEVSDDEFDDDDSFQAPVKMTADQAKSVYSKSTRTSKTSSTGSSVGITSNTATAGLSIAMTRKLFPYHITLSKHFVILDVGEDLPKILDVPNTELVGRLIEDVFLISKPDSAKWTKGWLRRLEGQTITLDSLVAQGSTMRFAGSVVTMIDSIDAKWMLILAPDASNLTELRGIGLTLSDLPAHGCYRDAVFLREHLSSQMQDALKMEKLSKSLQREKGLLESLLPQHAAEGLRMGRTVKPRLHNNVTIFFSDVVGFTSIADKLYPWQVINMLNQLYCIMDFLAIKFHLFKIETIGDAYVCCSGLPVTDENHAKNVANFALAVRHCCRHVKSPVDGEPIQLRIGIHSGACASGVVGVTNPRYCVFGDTMNTTARHETTGMANMIHCSSVTRTELSRNAPNLFSLKRRGKVEMKGKGTLTTYWLDASESNETFTGEGLAQLDELVLIELGQMASFGADDTLKQDQTKLPASPVKSDCSLDMEAHDNRFLGDMLACLSPLLPTKKNNPFGLPPGMLLSPTPSLMMFI
jgi:class 3 adenylate cyclase